MSYFLQVSLYTEQQKAWAEICGFSISSSSGPVQTKKLGATSSCKQAGVSRRGLPCLLKYLPLFSTYRHLASSAPDDSPDKWAGADLCCSSGGCAREPAGNQTYAPAQHCWVDLRRGWGGQQVTEQRCQPHWFASWQCCSSRGHSRSCSENHSSRAQWQIDSACHEPQ